MSENTQDVEVDKDGSDFVYWLRRAQRMPMGRWFKIEQRYDMEMTTLLGMTGRMLVVAANEKQRATSQMDDFDHLESLSLKELEERFQVRPPAASDEESTEEVADPRFPAGAAESGAEVGGLVEPGADGDRAGVDPASGARVPSAADQP